MRNTYIGREEKKEEESKLESRGFYNCLLHFTLPVTNSPFNARGAVFVFPFLSVQFPAILASRHQLNVLCCEVERWHWLSAYLLAFSLAHSLCDQFHTCSDFQAPIEYSLL